MAERHGERSSVERIVLWRDQQRRASVKARRKTAADRAHDGDAGGPCRGCQRDKPVELLDGALEDPHGVGVTRVGAFEYLGR